MLRASDLIVSADVAQDTPLPPTTDVEAAAEVVIDLFRRAGRALRASDFDAPGEWAAALTMPQLRVLYLLGRHPSLPVNRVAEAMRISQPSATETIDRLVRAGYVSRTMCSSDRRVMRTALTAAGRTLIDRPWEARRALLSEALAGASAEQQADVLRGLATLCEILNDRPASAPSLSAYAPPAPLSRLAQRTDQPSQRTRHDGQGVGVLGGVGGEGTLPTPEDAEGARPVVEKPAPLEHRA